MMSGCGMLKGELGMRIGYCLLQCLMQVLSMDSIMVASVMKNDVQVR